MESISEAARAQAEAITANYHNLTVEKDEKGAVVDFDSPAGHQHFSFASATTSRAFLISLRGAAMNKRGAPDCRAPRVFLFRRDVSRLLKSSASQRRRPTRDSGQP